MTAVELAKAQLPTTTTSYGGENIVGFRVTKSFAAKRMGGTKKRPRSLAQANAWLIANAARVDAHSKVSTKRLIGRDSV
jgi:hypothetical protein